MATRASNADKFGAAANRPRQRAVVAAPPMPGAGGRRKFTMRIEAEHADAFSQATANLGAELGRTIEKNIALCELAKALVDDPEVYAKMLARLRRQ